MKVGAVLGFPTMNMPLMLAQGQAEKTTVEVKGTTDGKETDYVMSITGDSVAVKGKYAGEEIDIVGEKDSPTSMHFKSKSGVEVDEKFEAGLGGFGLSGKIDGKDVQNDVTLNPMAAFDGVVYSSVGSIAGAPFGIAFQAVSELAAKVVDNADAPGQIPVNVKISGEADSEGKTKTLSFSGSYGDVKVEETASLK